MHLPFTESAFVNLFASFNQRFWPVLILLWTASLIAAFVLARGDTIRSRGVLLLTAAHWLWSGIAFHALFFTQINRTAGLFAALFVVQGLLFIWAASGERVRFAWEASVRSLVGLAFVGASLAYPALVWLTGHRLPAAPAYGVPCPTALFTTGVLLCAVPPVPRVLVIIPVFWSLVGGSAAFSLGMTPDLLLLAGAASLLPLLLPDRALTRIEHWGTPDEDATRSLAGDTVSHPAYEMTLARTVNARPEHVWPWLLQLGYRRGGLYSYDWLDQLFGYLDRPSARTLLPSFQHLSPGDVIPVGRGAGFPVQAVAPQRSLVLGGAQDGMRWSWEIALAPTDSTHTRIISRSAGDVPHTLGTRIFMALLGPAAYLMTRRMLIGIGSRAEQLARS